VNLLRKFVTWYVAGFLILVAAGAIVAQRGQDDRKALRGEIQRAKAFDDRRAYELCLTGNESRKAIVDAFHAYTDALIAASSTNPPKTAQERGERDRSIRLFRNEVDRRLAPLGPRPCLLPAVTP
jgi:hypothetical protein